MTSQKILVLKTGYFSHIDTAIYEQLKKNFPGFEIEIFDLQEKRREYTMFQKIVNLFYIIFEYGLDYIKGYKKIRDIKIWFEATSYNARVYRKWALRKIESDSYSFVFQIQTMFDGAHRAVPHFYYTDHTTLTNLLYPQVNPRLYVRSGKFQKEELNLYTKTRVGFVTGSHVKKTLEENYHIPASKIMVVGGGYNVLPDYTYDADRYKKKNILFVGVDWERKGGKMIESVFPEILKLHPDSTLTIVGCNPELSLPNCNIVGRIPKEQLSEYFSKASLFFFPTLREPYGLVVLEALLFKLPVVANNIGAMPDMVEDGVNGFLIDHDKEEYIRIIDKLFAEPSLAARLGEAGYNKVIEKFSWDYIGKKISDEIKKQLGA